MLDEVTDTFHDWLQIGFEIGYKIRILFPSSRKRKDNPRLAAVPHIGYKIEKINYAHNVLPFISWLL